MRGYVYVLTNMALPGLVKIGFSTKDPAERAASLSGTGVPSQFHVYYEALVDEPSAVERMLHDALADTRHRSDREFFALTPSDAVHRVRVSLEAYGCKVLFEPRRTYRCAACARWSFSEQCDCNRRTHNANEDIPSDLRRLGTNLALRSPEVVSLLEFARRVGTEVEKGKCPMRVFASSIASQMASIFETRLALPMLLVAAYMDDVNAQGWLASHGPWEDAPQERYFWARLESSNASFRGTSSGRIAHLLFDFNWLVKKVGIDAARDAEGRVSEWIARNRPDVSIDADRHTTDSGAPDG